ncbi:MAG: ABC transporter permease subunit, partial [Actinomycetota bacterium]
MSDTRQSAATESPVAPRRDWRTLLASTEIDTRLAGMVAALVVIWVGFHFLSDGAFLTSRNLWNLSVQSASIAIMATGMVLIIVSRNIDLSVGSLLGFLGYVMAVAQARWIPERLGLGFDQPYTWAIALAIGIVLGAAIGAVQGAVVAYGGVPAFIVTLGGFLVWRGLIFRMGEQGKTISPLDTNFQLLGGGPNGSLGEGRSWILAIIGCIGAVASVWLARRRRQRYELGVRPLPFDIGFAI